MADDDNLTVAQAAQQLGISRYQVYRRIMRGDLPATKSRLDNVHWIITQDDLNEYIAAGGAQVLSAPRVDHNPLDTHLRVPEAAILTGYSAEMIRRMCREGSLPYTKGRGAKGQFRIPRSALSELTR